MSAVAWWQHISQGVVATEKLGDDVCEIRGTGVKLPDGTWLVISPVRETVPRAHDWLEEHGRASLLLAPNHFHNMGLRSYVERHGARVVAASSRVARVTGLKTHGLELVRERLAPSMRLIEVPGTRTGEVWLSVDTPEGRAWIVGDAFTNFPRTPKTGFGAMAWMLGLTGGVVASPTFKWVALADRERFPGWLDEQLAQDRPQILVPAHGQVLRAPDLAQQLSAAAQARYA